MNRILVAGSAHVDILSRARSRQDVLDRIGDLSIGVGGTACNIAINLVHSGAEAKLLTAMNRSPFSSLITNYLESIGVALAVEYRDDLPTAGFSAHMDAAGDLVSAISATPIERVTFSDAVITSALSGVQAVIMDCNLSALAMNRIINMANDRNLPVYVCGVSEEKVLRLGGLSGRIKGVFMNKQEYRFFCHQVLTGSTPITDAARALGYCFIVTEGVNGATLAMPDGTGHHIPAPTVGNFGTKLGMGDALAAGTVLMHEIYGLPLKEAIVQGTAMVEVIGTRGNCHFGQADVLETAIESLQHRAGHDAMTGALNRISAERALDRAVETFNRKGAGAGLAVLMLDIDHFKSINDTYGHAAGDQVIIQLAETVKGCLREHDIFGRFGGEEFLVALPGTNEAAALHVAERIRSAVELQIKVPRPVTVSIGCAHAFSVSKPESLVKLADEALYEAKGSGRNRVCSSKPKIAHGGHKVPALPEVVH